MALKPLSSTETVAGVSEQELRWSQWWLDHRETVVKAGFGIFILADVILVGIGAWGFADWLAFGGIKEEQAIRQMTAANYAQFPGISLEELSVGAPIALQGSSGKIDILVPVENRNTRFWATVQYRLVVGGKELPIRSAFVLPGQATYLSELGASTENGTGVELKVEKRVWHRALTSGGLDQQDFAATRLNIKATDVVFKPADPAATSPVSSAAFTLENQSAFSYYDVGVRALLYRGDAIVGVNEVQIDGLSAGAKRPMEIFWYQSLPQVTRAEIVPVINIYDPNVYRRPGA
jgi:hypothetical protein